MHPDTNIDRPAANQTRWFLIFLGIAGAILLFISLTRRPHAPAGLWHPAVGDRLQSLQVEPLLNTERAVTLDDLEGKVALINFWGPWCRPCMMEMPELLKLEKQYRTSDEVQFVLISYSNIAGQSVKNLQDESRPAIRQFKSDAPVYHDADRKLLMETVRAIGGDRFLFPTTLLLDRQGKIRAIWTGYEPGAIAEMDAAIKQLLAESRA